jgi:deoxyribodipyrimidine photo-lyase
MAAGKIALFWFRRDLRLEDNAGLYHALRSGLPVQPIFIFDTNILDDLEDKTDKRVLFIHQALEQIQAQLQEQDSGLDVRVGTPMEAFKQLISAYKVAAVYTNHDYEPYAAERDAAIAAMLKEKGIAFHSFKDQVIFEKDEVVKDDGKPYTVFTPYSRKWKAKLNAFYIKSYPTADYFNGFHKDSPGTLPSLEEIGFTAGTFSFPDPELDPKIAKKYTEQRDFPAIRGTSRLGVHLRFGTISIRQLAQQATKLNETYLNELIWRDFYHMILWQFPRVGKGLSFKPEYDQINWRNNEKEFAAWCEGRTGYPIVDAGMRELNTTGYMHNRVRMIVASFLTKHLLIDWRWGEAYFAKKLLDFDLAANNGGWQWAAGSGCDAAPYFRIFNPYLQTKKFDPDGAYIKKWVPELNEFSYPGPIVDHEQARKRCLETYAAAIRS